MFGDTIVSFIRTYVPLAVGSALAYLGKKLGADLDSPELQAGFVVVVIAIYYGIARFLEKRWPVFGYLLGVPKEPAYAVK